jgi:uncharacterized protein
MKEEEIIKGIEEFARRSVKEFDSGHDWWHLQRVRNLSLYLQEKENTGNRFVIELSSLLHDIDDKKFRTEGGPGAEAIISVLLKKYGIEKKIIDEVVQINKYISFSSGAKFELRPPEFLIVQDADRLDAIGAIGIARAFNYGGFRNNAIYIPDNESPSTIRHFYDKLLLLKDMMNTRTGRSLAEKRHLFLRKFLSEFYSEWDINEKRS